MKSNESTTCIEIAEMLKSYEKAKERAVSRYCKENNLDKTDANDYSKAVVAVLVYMPPISNEEIDRLECFVSGLAQIRNFEDLQEPCSKVENEYTCNCQCGIETDLKSEYGFIDKLLGKDKCPKGTAHIEPNGLLKTAQYLKLPVKIKPFEEGCYGMSEFVAFYAMNKLVECAAKNRGNLKICAGKYLEFRQDGAEEFRKLVVK